MEGTGKAMMGDRLEADDRLNQNSNGKKDSGSRRIKKKSRGATKKFWPRNEIKDTERR